MVATAAFVGTTQDKGSVPLTQKKTCSCAGCARRLQSISCPVQTVVALLTTISMVGISKWTKDHQCSWLHTSDQTESFEKGAHLTLAASAVVPRAMLVQLPCHEWESHCLQASSRCCTPGDSAGRNGGAPTARRDHSLCRTRASHSAD